MSRTAKTHPTFRPADVVLIGCGGTGSWLAEPLARLLAWHPSAQRVRDNPRDSFGLIDGDRWEARNSERQLCTPDDVGVPKAATFCDRIERLALPGIRPWACEEYLRSPEDVDRALGQLASPLLVICAVDNDVARATVLRWLDEFREGDWAYVDPGNAAGDVKGQVRIDGRVDGAPITASLLKREQYAQPDDTGQPALHGCAARAPERPQLLLANMMAATLTLAAVQGLLDGGDYYQETFFDVSPKHGLRVYTDGDRIPAVRLGG